MRREERGERERREEGIRHDARMTDVISPQEPGARHSAREGDPGGPR
jgi:hypothetical protein